MYRIIDSRDSGKTSRLMLIAKEKGATFVCKNPDRMQEKAYAYGITGIDFVSYKDFFENPNKGDYVVDEIEVFMQFIFEYSTLIGYTLSNE